jgi:hypothetical protein
MVPIEVDTVVATVVEGALLLRLWSRTWRPVPGPLSVQLDFLKLKIVTDGVEGG